MYGDSDVLSTWITYVNMNNGSQFASILIRSLQY